MTANFGSALQLEWQGQLSDLVTALVCAPNGSGWAASSAAGEVVWSAGLSDLKILQVATGRSIDQIAFSADSRWLAAGGEAGRVLIWNCDEIDIPPQLFATIDCGKWIEHLVWHPTAADLTIGYGAQVQIWDVLTSTTRPIWKSDRSSIFDLAWQPAGAYLAVAGYKGVQIRSASDLTLPKHNLPVDTASLQVAWSANGRYLAAGNLDRTLTIMDWHNSPDVWTLQGCPGKIRQIAWIVGTPTPCLAVASGATVVLWHFDPEATTWNGQLLEGHQGAVEVLTAHPQAPMFGSGAADGYTCLWSAQGESEQILTQAILSGFTAMAWHPYAAYLGIGNQAGAIGLWVRSA